jgi:hypothetical protein
MDQDCVEIMNLLGKGGENFPDAIVNSKLGYFLRRSKLSLLYDGVFGWMAELFGEHSGFC